MTGRPTHDDKGRPATERPPGRYTPDEIASLRAHADLVWPGNSHGAAKLVRRTLERAGLLTPPDAP
jgi:hypothetical protein